jgi:hypothetical protein
MSESQLATVPVRIQYAYSVNGCQPVRRSDLFKLTGEGLGEVSVDLTVTFPLGKALHTDGIILKWGGEPLGVRLRIPAEKISEAMANDGVVVVPLEARAKFEMREGKEVVRNANGQLEGVIDTKWAELRWAE